MKKNNVTIFVLIFFGLLVCVTSAKDIEFGDMIEPIAIEGVRDNPVTVPTIGKVSVLFFFSTKEEMHSTFLLAQEPLFVDLVKGHNRVHIFFVTIGDDKRVSTFAEKDRLHFTFINDTQKRVFASFNYSCGTCLKVAILDGEGIVRYSAFKIAPYFIKSIVKRYESCEDETR